MMLGQRPSRLPAVYSDRIEAEAQAFSHWVCAYGGEGNIALVLEGSWEHKLRASGDSTDHGDLANSADYL